MLIYFNLSVTKQHFQVDIFRESVIAGNDALFSCSVPSFVADFVRVDSWVDSEGNLLTRAISGNEETFSPDAFTCCMFEGFNFSFLLSVTNQRYEINISPESIITGNDAIFKCSIPSFVSDFVSVESWRDSEANSFGSSFLGKNSCCNIFQRKQH